VVQFRVITIIKKKEAMLYKIICTGALPGKTPGCIKIRKHRCFLLTNKP
jgi:hypothetical protein